MLLETSLLTEIPALHVGMKSDCLCANVIRKMQNFRVLRFFVVSYLVKRFSPSHKRSTRPSGRRTQLTSNFFRSSQLVTGAEQVKLWHTYAVGLPLSWV